MEMYVIKDELSYQVERYVKVNAPAEESRLFLRSPRAVIRSIMKEMFSLLLNEVKMVSLILLDLS